ncbi:MAG: putative collagen-binding domain-containing protein, partial [Chthoniobacteraceae bacterium]
RDGKGKNLIGALNYLAGKGVNAFSFLTYNAAGDGDNVWPFIERNQKLHYDCSKLDQWGVVFDHATKLGLYLHFKLQENESDDERLGMNRKPGKLPEALDGGKLGIERKLYCRELIARFGHALALNWNIGEENTQSTEEVCDMVKYLHDTDPYRHHIVLHTFPPEMEQVYRPLLGDKSLLTGVSMQTGWKQSHKKTLQWRAESAATGRAWVVAHDEQNPASLGVPPDPGYKGHSGIAEEKNPKGKTGEGFVASAGYTMHDIRKSLVWGHYLAGGAGLEYYFGYQLPENDLNCEDFRSREKSWDYCRITLDFFRDEKIPFAEMTSANALIGNARDDNSKFCFAKAGELYLVYLPDGTKGGSTDLDLSGAKGTFTVKWFNPRSGGALVSGSVKSVEGGKTATTGNPPSDAGEDWLIVVRR